MAELRILYLYHLMKINKGKQKINKRKINKRKINKRKQKINKRKQKINKQKQKKMAMPNMKPQQKVKMLGKMEVNIMMKVKQNNFKASKMTSDEAYAAETIS